MILINILIGTGVLWLIKAILVMPIARCLTNRQMVRETGALSGKNRTNVSAETIDTRLYILVDVLVMGIAGFLMGMIAGWFFIGITWEGRGWPGMLTFIGLSILGSLIHG